MSVLVVVLVVLVRGAVLGVIRRDCGLGWWLVVGDWYVGAVGMRLRRTMVAEEERGSVVVRKRGYWIRVKCRVLGSSSEKVWRVYIEVINDIVMSRRERLRMELLWDSKQTIHAEYIT